MTAQPQLGAPGIYRKPRETSRSFLTTRMDVCAFVGVAPRGPARLFELPETWRYDRPFVGPNAKRRRSVAVPVDSFDEYRRHFGGFEGPGRLPFAVASFFEQGGRRAYVVRVVHDYEANAIANEQAVATGRIIGVRSAAPPHEQPLLVARNEGAWGNRLRAAMGFTLRPLLAEVLTATALSMPAGTEATVGSLLRFATAGHVSYRVISHVLRGSSAVPSDSLSEIVLDGNVPAVFDTIDLVEGVLRVEDTTADGLQRAERYEHVGLSPNHPRWLATVLCNESELVYPHHDWVSDPLLPLADAVLPQVPLLPDVTLEPQFTGGIDRYIDIVPEDFFDRDWVTGNPEPGAGVQALSHIADIASFLCPDLYAPFAFQPPERILDPAPAPTGSRFERCFAAVPPHVAQEPKTDILEGLLLDPRNAAERERITELQRRIADFAEGARIIALLDVPPGLSLRQIRTWREHFRTSFVAAYHPWVVVARADDFRDGLVRLNPSAIAAGVIAERELRFGVPHGPANVVARGVIDVDEVVTLEEHHQLHPLGINVLLRKPDGIALTAARTLSADSAYRQLSVRRLMLMLARTLERQTQWMVFEPNTEALWADVRQSLNVFLRRLYLAGAFKGRTETEAFFVRCDATLNTRERVDAGQLVVEVGVAPAEPLEFLVVRIVRDGDGKLVTEV